MINIVAWVFLALVWGTTWAVVKVGLETLPPMMFSGIRFAIAGLLLLAISWGRGRLWPSRSHWPLLAGTAVMAVAVPYGLQFWGQQHIASGLASVLTATIPVMVIFMAHWALPDEPLSRRKLLGASLGFVGVVAIFSDQLSSSGTLALLGSIALVVGALSTSWSQVWIKMHARTVDPVTLAAWQMGLGSVPLLMLGLTTENAVGWPQSWPLEAVISLLYLALFGSAIAFLVLYWLFRRVAVTKVLTVAFANPVVAVVLGWVWFGEVFSPVAAAGSIGVMAGLWLILRESAGAVARTEDGGYGDGATTVLSSS